MFSLPLLRLSKTLLGTRIVSTIQIMSALMKHDQLDLLLSGVLCDMEPMFFGWATTEVQTWTRAAMAHLGRRAYLSP